MGLRRPEKFSEVKGHDKLVNFILERIQQNTFPQFTLYVGEEGLGKTTIMKLVGMALNCTGPYKPCYECPNCLEITDKVIRQNKDTQSVKSFKMSVEGGEGVAKEVIASMKSIIKPNQKRVLILDEGHGMMSSAQDILLTDTEYIPEDTYILLGTSEPLGLKNQLLSRAVQFTFNRLENKDLASLLKMEARRRGLTIQGEESAFDLIISWSENKARRALKVLEAMGENINVSLSTITDFIDYLDISRVVPIISSLGPDGSIIVGMNAVMELQNDQNTHRALVEILQEALKVSLRQKTTKFSNEDNKLLIEATEGLEPKRLAQFLYEVAAMRQSFSRQGLLAAYLKCHPMLNSLTKPNPEVLSLEMNQKFMHQPEDDLPNSGFRSPPTLEGLLGNSKLVE